MQTMLSAVTTTVTGTPFSNPAGGAYQATVVGTGAVGATVVFEVSIDGVGWLTLSTVTLSGTTTATDGFVAVGGWPNIRARVSAVSGTGAAVTALMA
ncbi:MAG: hypothetical protein KBE22_03255 [Candidatus Accumulibacter sp.]|jgi:hypothetical protein|nr:hypothetical protein [Azonexus sp.]MBP9803912.1 hypothetical protein [Accumulibacter sp.]